MALSIIPMVHGNRVSKTGLLALYVVGLLLGGAIMGGSLGAMGGLTSDWSGRVLNSPVAMCVLVGVHLLLAFRELGVLRFWLPQSRWQVPRVWQKTKPPSVVMVGYGAVLGAGVLTRVRSNCFYAWLLWTIALGSVPIGLIGFAVYASGRALPLLVISGIAADARTVPLWLDRFAIGQPIVQISGAGALFAVAGWLLGTGLR